MFCDLEGPCSEWPTGSPMDPARNVTASSNRATLAGRALVLEQISIAWMLIEGGVAVASGILAHSVALIGFGLDSGLEFVAAIALYRRLRVELRGGDAEAAESAERSAMRVVGVTLLVLAAYVVVDAGLSLYRRSQPHKSSIGLGVAAVALIAMPLLGRAKLLVGRRIGSRALVADAKETFACAWLSAAVIAGVGLNAALGWWWADPIAALIMVPFIAREGREALEEAGGHSACSSCSDDGD